MEIEIANDNYRKVMTARGVPKQTFSLPSFNTDDSLTSFTSEVENLKPIKVSRDEQFSSLKKVLKNPFFAPYIYCIAGKPNDMKAKLLAVYIFRKAMQVQQNKANEDKLIQKYLSDKTLPVYSNLYGGWGNNPLADKSENPSLLVLSNVPSNSTNFKLEKLRDMLEMYSDIPRIVITTGTDPITFFNSSLYMHLNLCSFLTNANVKKDHEI